MALLTSCFCRSQRYSIKRFALISYVLLLVAAAVVLTWAGFYLYFAPAIASVAPLFFAIACCNRASAVKTSPAQNSDQPDPVSNDTLVKIEDEFHPLELHQHPAVQYVIQKFGYNCKNLRPWRPYTHEELITATNNFDQRNRIGKGGQADVFRGVEIFDEGTEDRIPDGRNIAVKRFYFVSDNAEELHRANVQFKREMQALSRASHRNVVEFYGYCIHGQERLLVSELMSNGSLHDMLFPPAGDSPKSVLDWGQRLGIAKDAARGLDYLHNYCNFNIVHLDMKPQNILLDGMLHAKIADFGLSKLIGTDQTRLVGGSIVGGTPGYMPPELNCLVEGWENNITKMADVYSFGIVLLQLASGRRVSSPPTGDSGAPTFSIPGQTFRDGAFHLVKTQQTQLLIDASLQKVGINSKVGQRILEIGAMCVEINPMDRPNMHEVSELLNGICPESVH